MKQAWQVQRSLIERPDGFRRWDYAYQCLLQWAQPTAGSAEEPLRSSPPQEASHERRDLCPRLDAEPTTNPDH